MKPTSLIAQALALMLFLCSGCTRTLVSSNAISEANQHKGVVYYLPKKLVRVTIDKDDSKFNISVEALPAVPDERYCFVANQIHSRWRTDDFKITTTTNGLLNSVEGSSEDQSGQIVVKLTEAAKQAFLLAARMSFPAGDPAKAVPEHFEYVFDPSSKEIDALNTQLANRKWDLKLEVEAFMPEHPSVAAVPNKTNGVIYRRAVACMLTVKQNEKVLARQPLVLPNFGPIVLIPIQGGSFSKTTFSMKFQDGILTEMASNKPSEVLGFVSILPDALKNIASIPAEILQLKVDYSSKQKELLKAQKEIIDAQNALIEAQKPAKAPNPVE